MDTPAVTGDADGDSNYGSDFTPDEETLLNGLLQHQGPSTGHDEEDNPNTEIKIQLEDPNDDTAGQGIKIPLSAFLGRDPCGQESGLQPEQTVRKELGDKPPRLLSANIESLESRAVREGSESIEAPLDPKPHETDLRSPLERFRTQRKGLSVTDLISPSWCELQYWYVLTKHGRKRRTPEMKKGSSIHQTLEDQVHTTVPVRVTTKEDSWGLRIWNMIQGLRTLRETRMTREFEVWGVIDGLVVRGVIDEISYTCPDPELEVSGAKRKAGKKMELGADQTTITDFLGATGTLENNGAGLLESLGAAAVKRTDKVYLTDVKTRSTKASLPKGASFRPTALQLMLYHRMLSDMAVGKVDSDAIFDRYKVDADASFTDTFIAQIGHLNEGLYSASQTSSEQSQDSPISSQDSLINSQAMLLANNSLRALWKLLIREFSLTLPRAANSIGTVLKAEYRDQTEGDILGVKTFLYEAQTLDKYIEDELRWWRGERAPQGVCIEEAYKCGYCEFAEECSWRKNKIEDATQKMRERKRSLV